MNFEEYKKIFEEVLIISDKLIEFLKKNEFEQASELFEKRSELFSKISSLPENITEEQFSYIQDALGKFKEKDGFIKRFSAVLHSKIKLSKIDDMYNKKPSLTDTDSKDNITFKSNNNSIFDN